jgi:lysophospholipase L1-like esterase
MLLACIAGVVALGACLVILDAPSLDTYPAAKVKRLRLANVDNVAREEGYARYRVNALGLIGRDPSRIQDPRVIRVAVFGDSFIEGTQVAEAAHFVTRLQQQLSAHTGQPVDVWNFGFSGDNTGNALARWQHRPPNVRFDAVIFTYNDGDLEQNTPQDAPDYQGAFLVADANGGWVLDDSRIDTPEAARPSWLRASFPRLLNIVYRTKIRVSDWLALRKARIQALVHPRSPDAAHTARPRRSPAQLAESTFAQLRYVHAAIKRDCARVFIVGLPTSRAAVATDRDASPRRRAAYLALGQQLAASGLPYLDLLPEVERLTAQGQDLYGDWEPGGHYNEIGHGVIARHLLALVAPGLTRAGVAQGKRP